MGVRVGMKCKIRLCSAIDYVSIFLDFSYFYKFLKSKNVIIPVCVTILPSLLITPLPIVRISGQIALRLVTIVIISEANCNLSHPVVK